MPERPIAVNAFPLVDAAAITSNEYSVIIRNQIQEENTLMDLLPVVPVPQGNNAHGWFEETSRGSADTRAINQGWIPSYARFIPKEATLTIFGGEIQRDVQLANLYGDRMPNWWEYQASAKARATYYKVEETIIEGDPAVDPNAFMGLRGLAEEMGNVFDVAEDGDAGELTLELLDEVAMEVGGSPFIWGNTWHLRKINALMRAAHQAQETVDSGFGRMIPSYAGMPFIFSRRRNDGFTMLGFDEDPGDGGDDASSMYVINPIGPEEDHGVHLIVGAGSAFEVYGLGESFDIPQEKGRLEVTMGLVAKGMGFARIKGIGQI